MKDEKPHRKTTKNQKKYYVPIVNASDEDDLDGQTLYTSKEEAMDNMDNGDLIFEVIISKKYRIETQTRLVEIKKKK